MANKTSKKQKSGKTPISRVDRVNNFCTYIANMDINEEVKLTQLHNVLGIHVESLKDIVSEYKIIKDAGKIDIIMDKAGKIKRIVRVKEADNDLQFKKDIRENLVVMNGNLANINNRMDNIEKEIKEKK